MSVAFLRKYATGTGADIYVPMIKRGVVDYAVGADWTPAAGDVKVSLDGAAAANIGTLPTAVTMGNTAMWKFVFSNAELTCKVLAVTVADSATKAVEDQMFAVETYGNASAMYGPDFSDAVRMGMTALPNAAAGASGGVLISGSNSGTTTFGALTVSGATTFTGNVSAAGGVTITQSTTNGDGLSVTGNGSGAGIHAVGGATGSGLYANGQSGITAQGGTGNGITTLSLSGGAGISAVGNAGNPAVSLSGGATGNAVEIAGGVTSGKGISVTTTSGDGISVTPTAGNALVLTANGTSKHGAVVTGGTAGTSDGIKAVAGTGGVPIRGAVESVTGKVTPIDVDGITFASALEALLAVLSGVATVSGSDVSFKKRDGTTSKITVTVGGTPGARTASVINS